MDTNSSVYVGIDVSKSSLNVHILPTAEAFSLERHATGLDTFIEKLQAMESALIVLEATGGFEITVAAALAMAVLPVVVMNPRQIRDFARATGRLDAAVIAFFAERIHPPLRPLPDDDARALSELVSRRQIIEMIVAENNRRLHAQSKRLLKQFDTHIAWLQKTSPRSKQSSTRPFATHLCGGNRCPH
jgi:transposase